MRCAVNLAYNGTHYLGSQAQKETPNTILGNLQRVCTQLGIDSKLVASGRTDKGVRERVKIGRRTTIIRRKNKILKKRIS